MLNVSLPLCFQTHPCQGKKTHLHGSSCAGMTADKTRAVDIWLEDSVPRWASQCLELPDGLRHAVSHVLRRVGADSVWSCPQECPCSPCTDVSSEQSTILDTPNCWGESVLCQRDMPNSCEFLCLVCPQRKHSAGSVVCPCLPSLRTLAALRFCAGKRSGWILPSPAPCATGRK